LNIAELYQEKELEIVLKTHDKFSKKKKNEINDEVREKAKKELPPSLQIDRSEKGPWRLKCLHDKSIINKEGCEPSDYRVQISELRKKRTIQSKIVEYFVLKLFSKQSIFSLVDIIFKDMHNDHEDL
jgi:hypothetical protein